MVQTSSDTTDDRATAPAARDADSGTEGLLKLHKMSTTAGVGSGDYVAVNGTSIVALLLGVGSWLTLMNPVLLFIPVAAVICAIFAIRQIGESNGTQTGRPLAIIGLLLALGIGGWVAVKQISESSKVRADTQAVNQAIRQLGDQVREGRANEAYDALSPKFKSQVSRDLFVGRMNSARNNERFGSLQGIDSNNLVVFDTESSGDRTAVAAGLMRFDKVAEPLRQTMMFRQVDGKWVIDSLPDLFPPPGQPGGPGGPGEGPGAGPAGPPSPM
ncbi:MAG TPA: hypothetical protein VGN72_08405 [Tepidisphaeraceae bacterium]|jgi:type II secretory pathway pseudopilin PulG|nr:hypothetical protein [Tepidisphaeraceae bacterium]